MTDWGGNARHCRAASFPQPVAARLRLRTRSARCGRYSTLRFATKEVPSLSAVRHRLNSLADRRFGGFLRRAGIVFLYGRSLRGVARVSRLLATLAAISTTRLPPACSPVARARRSVKMPLAARPRSPRAMSADRRPRRFAWRNSRRRAGCRGRDRSANEQDTGRAGRDRRRHVSNHARKRSSRRSIFSNRRRRQGVVISR